MGDLTFPYAYVIPMAADMQQNPTAAVKFVNHARLYGAEVEVAKAAFDYSGKTYPAGTYVVKTAQPLRPLVNNLLWDGEDVRAQYGVSSMYDVSVWSLPYMWRFDRVKADTAFTASTKLVTSEQKLTGSITGAGPFYVFAGDDNLAIKTVNQMLGSRLQRGHGDGGTRSPQRRRGPRQLHRRRHRAAGAGLSSRWPPPTTPSTSRRSPASP